MKKIILALFAVLLTNCASKQIYSPDDEKASACFDKSEETTLCDQVRINLDPYRFHKLSDYQKNNLPPIPDLP